MNTAMLYDNKEEYQDAIKQVKDAISRVLISGESTKYSAGGDSREVTQVKLSALRDHLALLQQEYKEITGEKIGAIGLKAGW